MNAVRDLYFKLQKTNSKEAKEAQQQKLKDISQKHAKLRLRIDEQLRTLMKSYQPELSNEEKEWIDKLEKLSKQVSGESGYLARIKKVSSRIYSFFFGTCASYTDRIIISSWESNLNSNKMYQSPRHTDLLAWTKLNSRVCLAHWNNSKFGYKGGGLLDLITDLFLCRSSDISTVAERMEKLESKLSASA